MAGTGSKTRPISDLNKDTHKTRVDRKIVSKTNSPGSESSEDYKYTGE